MILQLAKTSPYLTGQYKLDIELFWDGEKISVKNCHVSPLADNLGETDSIEYPFFNSKLTDHIKRLQNRLGDTFFMDSPALIGEKILYKDENEFKDTYDHTYQAGVSRMRYEKYGKQFQLLCPIWTDSADELSDCVFTFKIKGAGAEINTSENSFRIGKEVAGNGKTPKLMDILNEYLQGMVSGQPDLLNINFDRNEVTIKGIEAATGTLITKDVSYSLEKMLDRERPLLEIDSMLCQLLPSNGLIARQVLNLNFCFNISDIMPPYLINKTEMNQWQIWCDITTLEEREKIVNDTKIIEVIEKDVEFRDLYTNYTSIPAFVANETNGEFNKNYNVLDYLEDHRCYDTIMANKVTQPIFHWALVENPDYIYNFYNGFSPVIKNNKDIKLGQGLFFNQPNPYQKEYTIGSNTLNWCKIKDFTNVSSLPTVINVTSANEDNYTRFYIKPNTETFWVNGMKFEIKDNTIDLLYMNIVYAENSDIEKLYKDSATEYDDNKLGVYCTNSSPYIISILLDPDNIHLKEVCSLHSLLNGNFASNCNKIIVIDEDVMIQDEFLKEFESFFKNYVYPWKIEFNKSLYAERVGSPDSNTTEFRYYKSDFNHNSYIYRYTGSLRPMMIKLDDKNIYNNDYFYKTIDKNFLKTEEGKSYNEYLKTNFPQLYPSIGYFPLQEVRSEYIPDPDKYPPEFEVKWYKNGRMYNLPEEVVLEFTAPADTPLKEEDFYSRLCNELKNRLMKSYMKGAPIINFQLPWDYQLKKEYKYKVNYDYVKNPEKPIELMSFRVVYNLR